MKKFTLKPEFSFTLLERKRLWFGLFAGLFLSFSFYLFGLLLKEGLRMFAEGWTQEVWVISRLQYYFLNYFLAFVSILFGSVAMFEIWFHKPKFAYKKKVYRNPFIHIEARAFIWYFIYWISTITILPWYFFGVSYEHYCFDFLSDYIYIFILLMVVLYFSLWTTFIRKFKSVWKFQLFHLMATVLLSALFTLYIPQEIENANKLVRGKQLAYKFDLDVPYVKLGHFQRSVRRSLLVDVHILRSKNPKNGEVHFLVSHLEYPAKKLEQAIQLELNSRDEWARRFVVARLFVDSEIKMESVHMLKGIFGEVGIYRIFFVVKKTTDNCNQPQLGEFGINQKIFPKLKSLKDNRVNPKGKSKSPPLAPNFYKKLQSQFINDSLLIIKVKRGRQFALNSDLGELDQISSALEAKWKPGYKFNLICDDNASYQDYINVLAQLDNFIFDKRNLLSHKYFGVNYFDLLDKAKYKQIRDIIPYYYTFSEEEIELILGME